MNQAERIKYIRKNAGLTLEKFGERLGVRRGAISNLENGSRNVTNQMATSIEREFNVRKEWLLNGDGEPYIELTKKEKLAEFFAEVLKDDDASARVQIIETFAELNDQEWILLAKLFGKRETPAE